MLTTTLLHPEILRALASSGHFAKILIADGNFSVASLTNPLATRVFLNLMPGVVKTTEVLEALLTHIVVQDAAIMRLPEGFEAPVQDTYIKMLPDGIPVERLERQTFYDMAKSPALTLAIATGDTRRFANIILTLGVVKF